MLNFRKIAAASRGSLLLRYFTENTPEPIHPQPIDAKGRQPDSGGRLTTYYTGRDGRASWRPDMPAAIARAAGIDPRHMPKDADLARLFEGKRADTGEAWSRHARKVSGFDLVFSPHKSVTLAAEFAATPAESAANLHAIDRANDAAMRYVAQVLGWARKGAGGEEGVEPGAVGWVSFRHSTARPTLQVQDGPGGQTYLMDAPIAGDPHAHIHNFLMNLVVTATGQVGSLNTRMLTDARVKEFGAYFQAVLADELRRLGIRTCYDAGHQGLSDGSARPGRGDPSAERLCPGWRGLSLRPGLRTLESIARVVEAVDKPVNANLTATGLSVADLAGVGVRRVSVGAALAGATYKAFDGFVERLSVEGRLP